MAVVHDEEKHTHEELSLFFFVEQLIFCLKNSFEKKKGKRNYGL